MTTSLFHSETKYYRESGRFGPVRFLVALGFCVLLIAVVGWLYAYCDLYSNRLSYFKVVLPCIYGLVSGAIIGVLLRFAHLRNRGLREILLVVLTAATLYGTWCCWEVAVLKRDIAQPLAITPLTMIVRPRATWELARDLNFFGTWGLDRQHSSYSPNVTGTVLWVIWTIEALLIVVCCYLLARAICSGSPYCEHCRNWTRNGRQLATLPLTDIRVLRAQLEAGDFVPMITQGPSRLADVVWLEVWTHSCKRCNEFNTLTVKRASNLGRSALKGFRHKAVIDRLLLSTVDLHALDAIREEHRKNRAAAKKVAEVSEEPENVMEAPDDESDAVPEP